MMIKGLGYAVVAVWLAITTMQLRQTEMLERRIVKQNGLMIDQGDINGATLIEIRDLLKAESTRLE